jgi:hypothetical protein
MTVPPSNIVNHQILNITPLAGVRRSALRISAMKKILIAMLVLSTAAPALAVEEEFCAMVTKVPDEAYVILRMEPGEQFEPRTKLVLNDFLYADTYQCSTWSSICTKSWTHVYSVHRIDGAPRDNLHGYTAGWIYTNYIKSVPCDWDWGYLDPDPPKNIDPP